MDFLKLRYIVVEGPIGAGKTSLARRLSMRLNAERLLEKPEDNPFLEKFYRDGGRYALPTQLFFLFQRIHQLRDLAQIDLFAKPVVSDFLIDKDPLFAHITLGDEELKLYRQIYEALKPQAPTPDLVIYLQAKPETLIERIARRGNPIEATISSDYFHAVCDGYSRFFHHYDAAPLLIVNTERMNPIDSDADFAVLVSRIEAMRGRREFFNLGP